MNERTIQTEFSKKNTIVGCFELKLCKSKSIRFDAVKQHQIQALLDVSGEKGLFHKINDAPIYAGMQTRFTNSKPFDCWFLKEVPAYIVICFYEPRHKKMCYYIEPEIWINLCESSSKKSIREEELTLNASITLDMKTHKL